MKMDISENMKLVPGLLLLDLLLSGCVSTDVVIFDSTNRTPTAESEVTVLMEKPARPHKVIARIQIGPDAFVADYQGQTKELIKRAATLGANAVIISHATGGAAASKFTIGQAIVYESE